MRSPFWACQEDVVAISFGSINTGLPPNIVEQLIEVEKMPIKNVEVRKEKVNEKLKLVNELETKLRDVTTNLRQLAGAKGFMDIKLISGDPNVIEGAVDPELVQSGSWNVEVLELATKASAISNGFPDKNETEIGVGYFRFDTPEGQREVYIHGGNNTLEGAAKAINAAGVGMRASVINDKSDPDNPWRLIISADKVGGDENVSYPTLYFLDGDQDFYFDRELEAKNGKIKIDGFEVEIPDNKIEDLVPGVSLTIKQAAPGKMINLTVKEDMEVVSGKIKGFVDSMNGVLTFTQSQLKIGEKTDTTRTLGGDSMVRSIENQLRQLIQGQQYGVSGEVRSLSQLGIQFNRNGTLEFDEEKFNQMLVKKSDHVQRFFVGDGFSTGFINTTRRTISSMLDGAFGPIANKKRGFQSQIDQADQRIESMERSVAMKEQNLKRKFANLEEKMSRLKSQGAQLQAKLGGAGMGGFNLGSG